MNILYLLISLIFSSHFLTAYDGNQITLERDVDLFAGDPLNTWKDPKDPRFRGADLKKYFSEHEAIRKEFFDIQQRYINKFYELQNDKYANFVQLGKDISYDLKKFLSKYLSLSLPKSANTKENIDKDEMAFLGFGSLARGESGPFTDLEGALLLDESVENKEAKGFLFSKNFSEILNGLLGHPIYGIKGFRLDEAENSPFHLAPFAKNLSDKEAFCLALRSLADNKNKDLASFQRSYFYPFEGTWTYSTTAKKLAYTVKAPLYKRPESLWEKWLNPLLNINFISAKNISNTLKNSSCMANKSAKDIENAAIKLSKEMKKIETSTIKFFYQMARNHTFVYGNKNIYDKFVSLKEKFLNEKNNLLRKHISYNNFKMIIRLFSGPKDGGDMFKYGKLPEVFDLKRQNYRFEEQLHTNLSLLYKLNLLNQDDIIKALMKKGIFGKKYGLRAIDRFNEITRLRWKDQIKVGGQLHKNMNFISTRAFKKSISELNKKIFEAKKIANDPGSYNELQVLMAKRDIFEANQELLNMSKVDPKASDAIFNEKEIEYLQNKLIPEQAESYKRLVAFIGTKSIPPRKDAFLDDFKWQNVDLKKYGIK